MAERRYPIRPRSDDDPCFTFGLTRDVAQVLEDHGYPPIGPDNPMDHVELSQALFRFLYGAEGSAP